MLRVGLEIDDGPLAGTLHMILFHVLQIRFDHMRSFLRQLVLTIIGPIVTLIVSFLHFNFSSGVCALPVCFGHSYHFSCPLEPGREGRGEGFAGLENV